MRPRPERLILIHGAWAGPWIWEDLIPALDARGWRSQALALPGDGTHTIPPETATAADFHATITDAIDAEPGPVALVGHSGGGMLVTAGAIARPHRVTSGIWVAGMLIPDGRSFDDVQEDIMGPGGRFGVTPHIVPSQDGLTSTVGSQAAIDHFFNDMDRKTAERAAARLVPQPTSGHRLATAAPAGFADLSKLYVVATEDRSVLPPAQRAMAHSTRNVTMREITSGHVPQLTQPAVLAGMIDTWLNARGHED